MMAVQQKVKTRKKHECPPHHFMVDSENVGHCKDCPEVRDFARLLRREGYGGKKAKKGGTKGKRGRKKKEELL